MICILRLHYEKQNGNQANEMELIRPFFEKKNIVGVESSSISQLKLSDGFGIARDLHIFLEICNRSEE